MLAFKNARLIDGTGVSPVENTIILISDGKFVKTGRDVDIPAGANIIDLNGKTVIPGLSDAHTHLNGSSEFHHPGMSTREESYNFTEMREGCLRWGVLTVRSCGQFTKQALSFREDVKNGVIKNSPRTLISSPMFQAPKGHPCYTVFMSNPDVEKNGCVMVDEDSDIEGLVSESAAEGVDFIKVVYGHINKMDYPNPVPRISKNTLERVIKAAHKNGLKAAVHVDSPSELRDALECGADTVEHVIAAGETETAIDSELIKLAKLSGAVIIPTMTAIKPFDPIGTAKPVWEPLKTAVKQLYEGGVTLAVGCDSGIPFVKFGESVHDEMAFLVEAGIPAEKVLEMATLGNAKLFGLEDRTGSIEAGKDADMIVLGSDPISDIKNTKDIRLVMQTGRIVYDEMIGR